MYYKVLAKCGHVGRNNYIEKEFFIKANSAKEAAYRVRWMPRVKHDRKDAILNVEEISCEQYKLGRASIRSDLFFSVTNSTEQRLLCAVDNSEIKRESPREVIHKSRNVEYIIKRQKIMDRHYKKMLMEVANG